MGVAVSVVFTGLCALVTGGSWQMPAQVLLVDAHGVGAVDGVPLPEHAPALVARLSALVNAETSAPTRVVSAWPGRSSVLASQPGLGFGAPEQIGIWDLSGTEVRVKVQGEEASGIELYKPATGASSWPNPPRDPHALDSWRDLRFVPDMQELAGDGRIDSELVADSAGGQPSARVASRVRLDRGRIEAGIPSQRVFREKVFEFRNGIDAAKVRQALTDTVRWSFETEAPVIVIEIVSHTGGRPKRLVLGAADAPHEIFISNLPAENTQHEGHSSVSADEMAALHFGAYYTLLKHQPLERPLPRPWLGSRERKATGLMGTTLCPPAHFSY